MLPPSPGGLRVDVDFAAAQQGVLFLHERGQDVVVHGVADMDRVEVQTPPRHGLIAWRIETPISLRVERLREGRGHGEVELRLQCDRESIAHTWQFLQSAHAVAASFTGGIGSLAEAFPEAALKELEADAYDPYTRALAMHLRAQSLYLAGRAADAVPAFIAAAEAWQAADDRRRAAAARVGAAEDLNRTGRYADALALTRSALDAPEAGHYFGVRLENARCLALHYLGQHGEAGGCYAWTSAAFDRLDETLELAVTAIDYAAVERSLGHFDAARALATQSLDLAHGPQAGSVRGRAHLLRADLAARSGQVAAAIEELRQAQQQFAAVHERRWEANTLLRLAKVLAELRVHADARAAAERALELFDPRHAAARVAATEIVLAQIDRAEHRHSDGLQRAESALRAIRALQMPEEAAQAAIELARQQLAASEAAAAAATLDTVDAGAPTQNHAYILLRAEIELARDESAAAGSRLREVDADALSLEDRVRHARALARLDVRAGQRARASARLLDNARALQRLAAAGSQGVLAQMLDDAIRDLRATAIELVAIALDDGMTSEQAVTEVATWLALTMSHASARTQSGGSAAALDAAVGRVLLDPAAATDADAGWRALLALLADTGGAPRNGEADARSLVAAMRASAPMLLLLPGEQRALLLWVDRDSSLARPIEDLRGLRERLSRLQQIAGHASGDVRALETLAAEVSAILLGEAGGPPRPARLRVLNDGLAAAVPWPLLNWPGDRASLAADMALSLVEFGAVAALTVPPATIDVVRAMHGDALPALAGARVEPELISRHAARAVRVHADIDRDGLVAALATHGAWLHVSTHGALQPGRLAGSGLWLGGTTPHYVSGLDFLHRGASAALLVLNVCELAATPVPSSDFAFASTLSRAGVRDVVAARWPVSDTAAALWVPAFYGELVSSGDAASALRATRRALRESRAYRHPFYWAGWVHIERIGLAPRE